LWIYRYIANYFILKQLRESVPPHLLSEGRNMFALVGGLILLIAVSIAMLLLFYRLNTQFKLTSLYDNFIASVTHELKSPVASMQLHLETMEQHAVPRRKRKEFIGLMLKDASRLEKLINAILEIPGLERKKIARDFQVYEVQDLIDELIAESIKQFNLPEEAVRVEGNAPCRCVMDRNTIKIVLDNLFDNAIKYSEDPVRISISLMCTSKLFVLEFSDHGIGILPKNQRLVFNKFFRIYDRYVPDVKGTGLGLYWARQIVRYHGGRIHVHSEGLGMGSTFRVELPIFGATRKLYLGRLLKRTQRQPQRKGSSAWNRT
jgi:signal transduction histidine kinase